MRGFRMPEWTCAQPQASLNHPLSLRPKAETLSEAEGAQIKNQGSTTSIPTLCSERKTQERALRKGLIA
jgi:hypothetical protein